MRIRDLSLREKVLQTVVLRHKKDHFTESKVGALFFGGEIITEAEDMGLDKAREILCRYIDNADIPPLITSDFENGCGSMVKGLTPFPYLSGLGATNDANLAYAYGKATALEALSIGANWSLSPVCDLLTNPRNPLVNVRALTDDPHLASKLLPAMIRGMQDHGLLACAKHFPGDGVDYRDQHIVTTCNSLSMEEWWQLHGKVFADCIAAGVMSIMPGHITLPAYQQDLHANGLPLPATLSQELIENLLKKEMGFEGIVVTDALDMGGFNGWYESKRRSQIEAFKAGCDMMLWPGEEYVDDLIEAVENGYVPMERLDDAVSRILAVKEKMGLFEKDNHPTPLSCADQAFVDSVQQKTAERSVTLIKDTAHLFPLDPQKIHNILVVPVTHYEPALEEAKLLCSLLESHGFAVTYQPKIPTLAEMEASDLVLFALFSRSFRPIGFLDFQGDEARKIGRSLQVATEKTAVVSFGSPYFGNQYFERAPTYVNAYSMLAPSVKAFVRAAMGQIPFGSFSPFRL